MTRPFPRRFAAFAMSLGAVAAISNAPHAADVSEPRDRGAQVYARYCALCHGASGKGDGRAAGLQKKAPANLTTSRLTQDYRLAIVERGGAAMKRSSSMPAWRDILTEEEIADVVGYLEVLAQLDSSKTNAASTARATK